MEFIQRNKYSILLSLGLVLIYFLTRLYLLTLLPIFTDEAIYIRWSQISLHDSNWRFISLTDGKQPLFIWAMMFFVKFIHDPLIAGRLVSVVSGFGSMIGLWLLSYALFKNKIISFISSLLYIFYPLALLHDRLAIYDSMAAMWYIFALYFSILLVKKNTLLRSYNLGFILGASVLTKSGGFISMALLPLTLFLFDFKSSNSNIRLWRLLGLGIISVVIGLIMYGVLRLSPLYGMIATKNSVFIYPLSDWLSQTMAWRISLFTGNFWTMAQWFITYVGIMYLIFLIAGLLINLYWKEKLVLIIYFILPFVYAAMFGKVLFPRYILFMSDIILPIVALGIWETGMLLSQRHKKVLISWHVGLTLLAVVPTMYVSLLLITNPLQAPIPQIDRYQYMGDWPAGWGVKEAVKYFQQLAQAQHIFIGTEGTFGLMPYAFEMYLVNNPNVTIKAYWPINQTLPPDLLASARRMPTYIYFYEPCTNCPNTGIAPVGWQVTPVFTLEKNNNRVHVTLYRVLP